eukprot:NODE_83_length_22457_cov_0.375794.p11 type:complete len:138 gc:universal NODE_83_length_22457_cov_0.375794:17841-17428(-)
MSIFLVLLQYSLFENRLKWLIAPLLSVKIYTFLPLFADKLAVATIIPHLDLVELVTERLFMLNVKYDLFLQLKYAPYDLFLSSRWVDLLKCRMYYSDHLTLKPQNWHMLYRSPRLVPRAHLVKLLILILINLLTNLH